MLLSLQWRLSLALDFLNTVWAVVVVVVSAAAAAVVVVGCYCYCYLNC